MKELAIKKIRVRDRFRKDLGDLDSLAASIDQVGLLHPIVVRPDGRLIAGERRLAACKELGWTSVPVTLVDLKEVIRGEFAENAHRKNFLPSEIDAIPSTIAHRKGSSERTSKAARRYRSWPQETVGAIFPE
jgi:ParB family chromosome partitioning protein